MKYTKEEFDKALIVVMKREIEELKKQNQKIKQDIEELDQIEREVEDARRNG